jgi:hypothetical protein
MQKIDRLVWAEGACFEAYGVRIGIRANHTGALQELLPYLTPSWSHIGVPRRLDHLYSWLVGGQHGPNVRSLDLMYSGAGRIVRTSKREEVFEAFERDLRMMVAALSRRFVFIHAGAVGLSGKALILPGPSFSGKSTLVAALVRAGAEYLSDEFALLDQQGSVHPYAKAISLREADTQIQKPLTIASIGGRVAKNSMKVRMILTARYRDGAKSRIREVSSGLGTLDLMANALAARETPARVLTFARRASTGAKALRGTRGDADATAIQLLEVLKHS